MVKSYSPFLSGPACQVEESGPPSLSGPTCQVEESGPPSLSGPAIHTDWSRTSRKHLALLKAGAGPTQTQITSFFDRISQTINEMPAVKEMLEVAQRQGRGAQFGSVGCMLKELLANAEKNVQKLRQGLRHQHVIKKFATSLLIYCGPMAYNFLHRNLQDALPSLRTVQRIISKDYKPFYEGQFRFDELLVHLISYKAVKVVSLGEDARRLIGRVEYMTVSQTDLLGLFCHPMKGACHCVMLSQLRHLSQSRRLSKMVPLQSMHLFTWCSHLPKGFLHFAWPV